MGQRIEYDLGPHPVYREVCRDRQVEPVKPGLMSHPVFQTVALAYALEQALDAVNESTL